MKTLIISAVLLLTSAQAMSYERLKGVQSDGEDFVTKPSGYYVVHGGCREANDSRLTEVWLEISQTRDELRAQGLVNPNPQGVSARMYLPNRFGTIESLVVCSFLSNALFTQTLVDMEVDSYDSNYLKVKSLNRQQILQAACGIKSPDALGNFAVGGR